MRRLAATLSAANFAQLHENGQGFTMTTTERRYQVVHFNDIPAVPCPCGSARRAFEDVADFPATIHRTEIHTDARKHYHRRLTETYYILECEPDAAMELDDKVVHVSPGSCVLIPPGVRHRAVGRMTVLIFVVPKFDPADEWFD
jgi:mannose-6-phosphate isomerase-like protein (cupin superfamily)